MMLPLVGKLGGGRLFVRRFKLERMAHGVQDRRKHSSGQKDGQEEGCSISNSFLHAFFAIAGLTDRRGAALFREP